MQKLIKIDDTYDDTITKINAILLPYRRIDAS